MQEWQSCVYLEEGHSGADGVDITRELSITPLVSVTQCGLCQLLSSVGSLQS